MNKNTLSGLWRSRSASMLAVVVAMAASAPVVRAEQTPDDRPMLSARLSRWQGDPVKKKKGPKGFDLQFRLVGARFDGTFGLEGLPQNVPEGEAFDAQIKLYNLGIKDSIKVTSVMVTGEGMTLDADVVANKVDPKSVVTVASFKVPPQSGAGSSFVITVVLSNGDKHRATLTFSKRS